MFQSFEAGEVARLNRWVHEGEAKLKAPQSESLERSPQGENVCC